MQLNERWLCLGETVSPADAGLTIFRAFPGSWWIASGEVMIGPFDDRTILRAVRVACTPTIDGCERGPTKLGVAELSPRRRLQRGPKWQAIGEGELPTSVTAYDCQSLKPVSGCCTTFDALPKVAWGTADKWEAYFEELPTRGGRLASVWNAHPAGSLVFTREFELKAGFVVVEFPRLLKSK